MRRSQTRAADHGGHLDVLGSIPAEYRKAILEQCEKRQFRKGEMLWSQGDAADYVAFLRDGKVMSTYHSPNGKIGVTGIWFAGDILGAADLGASNERQMTVRCLQDTVIYTLSVERFYEVAKRFPEVSQAIIRALSIRLRWVAHLALTLETQPALERICTVLLVLAERFSVPTKDGMLIDLSLTNEDLAAVVGVSRQFMNATLHDLQRRGIIGLKRRRIVLTDKAGLEDIAFRH